MINNQYSLVLSAKNPDKIRKKYPKNSPKPTIRPTVVALNFNNCKYWPLTPLAPS